MKNIYSELDSELKVALSLCVVMASLLFVVIIIHSAFGTQKAKNDRTATELSFYKEGSWAANVQLPYLKEGQMKLFSAEIVFQVGENTTREELGKIFLQKNIIEKEILGIIYSSRENLGPKKGPLAIVIPEEENSLAGKYRITAEIRWMSGRPLAYRLFIF